MKNIDKLKSLEAWDLAIFLQGVSDGFLKFTVCDEECDGCTHSDSWCVSQIGEWLIQEAE